MNECLFFGCWGDVGHSVWRGNKQRVFTPNLPFHWHKLDGTFIAEECKWKQGYATVTQISGLTILAFPDNSVDTRPASHSTFVMPGDLSFNECVTLARDSFPDVWRRYKFEVIHKENKHDCHNLPNPS